MRIAVCTVLILVSTSAAAQKAPVDLAVPAGVELLATALPGDWSTHYQYTAIDQGHPAFRSPYSGPNSLNPGNRMDETMSATAYLGRTLWQGGALYLDPELNQGFGLSHTTGLAGFSNGEAQKAGEHAPKLNIARFYLVQTIGLGGEQEQVEDDLNQVAGTRDVSRVTIYAGKLAANDLFDNNAYAHDPRNDFLNWSIWEGGAYDYAADQKGFSDGIAAELNQKDWALRAGGFLMPKRSNDRDLETRILQRGGYQAELEERYELYGKSGKLRLLGFVNRGFEGSYAEALSVPGVDITQTRKDRLKEGFVVNFEQAISDDLGAFARFSYNDGRNEIMSFTDIDRSGLVGVSLKGTAWQRADDTVGVAGVVNALSSVHARFLEAGGLGVLVGDGKLSYGTEDILEAYYRFQVVKPLSLTADYQFVANPAYNRDRGPVSIFALRAHLQF
ncbi:MAG TPA: carbohydrate porin [Stellaceae bacterium]|jgi:high affinity Mn2+ porin|nr:carbohydrate porin [Stellaceae bacterium]